jgi:hypothetical protein
MEAQADVAAYMQQGEAQEQQPQSQDEQPHPLELLTSQSQGDDAAYAAAMERLAELKARPIETLTEAEKKEKLCAAI